MSDMITAEEAGKLLDGTTPGPWRYRPHKHDDWGVVRGGVFNEDWGGYPHLAQVRDPDKLDDPILNAHRASGKDPWETNARLTAAAPDLARTVIALHAQLADAKAAQAMVVERAVQKLRATHVPAEWTHEGALQRGALDHAANVLAVIADTDGLALVQALRAERDHWEALAIARDANQRRAQADRDRLAAANAALEMQMARLVGALDMSRQGWRNALELELLPKQHRHAAKTMADIADAALAEVQADARREGGE